LVSGAARVNSSNTLTKIILSPSVAVARVREWLVLLTPDVEKAREMAGELAEAVGAEAEVLVVPFLERQLS
jgi:hypothetical protein